MRPVHQFVLLAVLFLCCFTSCQKIEFGEDDKGTKTEKPSTGGEIQPSSGDTLNITMALMLEPDTVVTLKGYIVGYVKGTSMGKAVFSLPDGVANTNLLLADSPSETDVNRCLPVALAKGGELQLREQLNLLDHPELMHCAIVFSGLLTSYFRVNGLKTIYDFNICEENGADAPENPKDTIREDWPKIDNNPDVIQGGR